MTYWKMKNRFKNLVQWFVSGFIAVCIFNGVLFFYNRPTGWIDREGGATTAIWDPGTAGLMGTEGYGIYHVDKKGYVNASLPLSEDYILVVGASYTQGKEVPSGSRYTDIMNQRLSISEDCLKVYNVSQDGYFLPDIMKGFSCILGEFPGAGTIILETATTEFTKKELIDAAEQRVYNADQNGENIVAGLSFKKKLSLKVKESAPLLSLLKKQYENKKKSADIITEENNNEMDLDSYEKILNEDLKQIRSQYKGTLMIMYHPTMEIDKKGTLIINSTATDAVFSDLCEKNNIIFVNMEKVFKREYEENYLLPYGFHNTSMGKGHFNKDGHRMIADELCRVLEGDIKK